MASAADAWKSMSANQQREVLTACVFVALGPSIKSAVPSLISSVKSIVRQEIGDLSRKPELTDVEQKYLKLLERIMGISASVEGLREIENLSSRTDLPMLIPLLQKCWAALPSIFKFSGFGSLIEHRALSKLVSFAMAWRYSGKGYEAPCGMTEPFSGYDDVMNSLMGHPLCKAEMAKQTALWEKANRNK